MDTFVDSLVQLCCGREEHCEQISLACVGSAHSVWATLGLPPLMGFFPGLHCSGSRFLCWELSEAGPGLHALPRSKLLRFTYSGTPQRHRLSWTCVLCPSQVRATQETRCLASMVAATYCLSRPCHSVFWYTTGAHSQADVDHPESQEVLVSNEACLQFGR